jgi:hypothetical protein
VPVSLDVTTGEHDHATITVDVEKRDLIVDRLSGP